MTVSRRLRFEILRRDGHACRYCGATAPDVALTVDHVIPTTLGGGDEPGNLVTACQPCNAGKSSMPADAAIVEDVDATAMLFAKAVEQARARRAEELFFRRVDLSYLEDRWNEWTHADGSTVPLPDDWRASIERFLSYGLEMIELESFIRDAMTLPGARNVFRVFCAKCWHEIGLRQELARRLIEDGEV